MGLGGSNGLVPGIWGIVMCSCRWKVGGGYVEEEGGEGYSLTRLSSERYLLHLPASIQQLVSTPTSPLTTPELSYLDLHSLTSQPVTLP